MQVPAARDQVLKPERVLVFTKKMVVAWGKLDERLRSVRSLDDVMRIDLHYLCRQAPVLAPTLHGSLRPADCSCCMHPLLKHKGCRPAQLVQHAPQVGVRCSCRGFAALLR